jgi:hypothetical protein
MILQEVVSKPPLRPNLCVGEMRSILKILYLFPAGGGTYGSLRPALRVKFDEKKQHV